MTLLPDTTSSDLNLSLLEVELEDTSTPAATDGRPPLSQPDGPLLVEQIELLMDRLADLLDTAHTQALRDPRLEYLAPVIRRGFEGIKLLVRRLEQDLIPLELDQN
jgi:hypothetical protein